MTKAMFDYIEWKGNLCVRPDEHQEIRIEPKVKIGSVGAALEVNPRDRTLEYEQGYGYWGAGLKVRWEDDISEEEREGTPPPERRGSIAPKIWGFKG
jgi:hypothetical protein